MTVTCYYCNASFPNNQAKRCSRCRIVTYCSKECQTLSWKASHKAICIPNPIVAALNGSKPEKFSLEWAELEADKLLTKWMAEWRKSFMHWATIALDLANHPPDRVVTHCLYLIAEPRDLQNKSYKNFCVVKAAVVPLSQIRESHPELVKGIDQTNFTRLRYVVRIQNTEGKLRRVRLLQFNVRSLATFNMLPKERSAELAGSVSQVLLHSVEQVAPDIVERQLGLIR